MTLEDMKDYIIGACKAITPETLEAVQ